MTRKMYGASAGDYFADASGAPVSGVVATVWSAVSGGVQVTDLLDVSSAPTTVIVSDLYGGFRFYGPDNWTEPLWIQAPGGTLRYRTGPVDGQAILLGDAQGARFWGGDVFPETGDGAQDGDFLFFTG